MVALKYTCFYGVRSEKWYLWGYLKNYIFAKIEKNIRNETTVYNINNCVPFMSIKALLCITMKNI